MYKSLIAFLILVSSTLCLAGSSGPTTNGTIFTTDTVESVITSGGGRGRGGLVSAAQEVLDRTKRGVGVIKSVKNPDERSSTDGDTEAGGGSGDIHPDTRVSECSVPTDNIPESLKSLLFVECKRSEGVTHKSYCDCIENKVKAFSGGKDEKEFAAKKKKSFDRLEELVVKKNADMWVQSYKKILDAQSQLTAIMGTDGFPIPTECSSAGLVNIVKNKIYEAEAEEDCPSSTLNKYLQAFGPSETAGIGPNYSSLEAVLNLPNPKIPKNGDKSSATDECLSPGFKGLLSMTSAITVPSTKPGPVPSGLFGPLIASFSTIQENVLNGMIKSLDSIIISIKNSPSLKAGEFEPSSLMQRHRRPDDFFAAKAIDAFPIFSYMVKNLSSPSVIDTEGKARAATERELKERRDQMLKQMIRLRDMYAQLLAIKNNSTIDNNQKASEAFKISANFMAGLKETIDIGNKNEAIAQAKLECMKLSDDFIRMACAPVVNISDARIVEAVLPRVKDDLLPMPGKCNKDPIADTNAESCLRVQNAECISAKQVNFAQYKTYDLLEVTPDLSTFTPDENLLEYFEEKNGVEISDIVCKDYSLWLRKQCKGKQDNELLKCKSLAANSPQAFATLNPDSAIGGIIAANNVAAQSAGIDPNALGGQPKYEGDSRNYNDAVLDGLKASLAKTETVDTTFGSQFLKAATVGAAATTTDNRMNNNSQIASFITPTQTITQQLAKKDEAIAAKESEISERVNDAKSIQDPVLKSAAEEELKALRAELASLKKEREALATAQQDTENQVVENAGNNKNGNQTNNRSPASVTGSTTGSSFSVGSNGSSTAGGSTGGGSTSGNTSGFGNTGSTTGGGAPSAPTTVQGALSSIGTGSSALLEANQLKLTVGGQEVAAQNVTTLQIPSGASRDVIQKVIQDNQSKLKFVDGVALVELIGADKKPVYYQVKKQGEGFELIAVKEDIPAQVRKWSASYANFLKKIQTIRGPSGQSTQDRQ